MVTRRSITFPYLPAAERLEFGMIGFNHWAPQSTEVPFAGWKQSGIGRQSGAEGLEEYLETRLIVLGDQQC